MAKVIRHIKDKQKEFIKTMEPLTRSRHTWDVWSDFVMMFAITLSNSIDKVHFKKREDMYLKIESKYSEAERMIFADLMSIVILAYEQNRGQDFLGELYMALNLGNHWKGQFFTPYTVCRLMSEISDNNIVEQVKEKGYISALDCCCGAGALLIAFADMAQYKLSKANLNFQNHMLFVGQDVDMLAGMMCYIQLSLLGCAGYVKIASSLSDPVTNGEAEANLWIEDSCYWYFPMYFSKVWQWRRVFHAVDVMTRHTKTEIQDNKKTAEPEDNSQVAHKFEYVIEKSGQISLF